MPVVKNSVVNQYFRTKSIDTQIKRFSGSNIVYICRYSCSLQIEMKPAGFSRRIDLLILRFLFLSLRLTLRWFIGLKFRLTIYLFLLSAKVVPLQALLRHRHHKSLCYEVPSRVANHCKWCIQYSLVHRDQPQLVPAKKLRPLFGLHFLLLLLQEGSCIISGLGYNGRSGDGRDRWDGCSNVHLLLFETAYTFQVGKTLQSYGKGIFSSVNNNK